MTAVSSSRVVLVNAIIGFIQESKALKAIEALAVPWRVRLQLSGQGKKKKLPPPNWSPGDLVLLQSGDKVPADLRLLRTRELQIDESALTGESVPVQKQPEQLPQQTLLADRSNIAYSSTLVTYGTGAGIAVATGDATEIGQINALIASADIAGNSADPENQPLQRHPAVGHPGACRPDPAGWLVSRNPTAR